MSTRARRTRKGASDGKPALERERSRQSLDDISRKDKAESGGVRRRNTNKKIDAEKAKSAASKEGKDKKGSDVRKPGELEKEAYKDTKEGEEEGEGEKLDDKNVVFCMWGHENCKTRSHYRYNWQWDYVQKYAEQNKKNVVQGYMPEESQVHTIDITSFRRNVFFQSLCGSCVPQVSKVKRLAADAARAQEEREREEREAQEVRIKNYPVDGG